MGTDTDTDTAEVPERTTTTPRGLHVCTIRAGIGRILFRTRVGSSY
jgi:hypothetical protein